MTDLQKTQAQWTDFMGEVGAELQVLDAIAAVHSRFDRMRSPVLIQFDQQEVYSSVDLDGDAVVGTNTDADGFIYVSYDNVNGGATQLYSDSARTALVASGATASGTTSTLNEKNSSGLDAVQVTLGTGPGAGFVNDTDIRLQVSNDFRRSISDIYENTGSDQDEEDKAETQSKLDLETRASTLATMFTQRRTTLQEKIAKTYWADFLEASKGDKSAGLRTRGQYDTSSVVGQVLLTGRTGIWQALRAAMQDETTAGAQSVQQGSPTSGNLVAQSTNTGQLKGEATAASSAISLTLLQHIQSGTLKITCVDEAVGNARFTVENVLDNPPPVSPIGQTDRKIISADNRAQVDEQFQDLPTGFDFTLSHIDADATETGDDGDILSSTTITDINASDTDFGKIFVTVERTKTTAIDGSDEFELRLYADSSRTTQTGSQTITGIAGTTAVSITTSNSMVFTSTFHNVNADTKLSSKNSKDEDIEFDLNPPRQGDVWEVTITEDFASEWLRILARYFLISINAGGSPTITDSPVKFFPVLAP